MIDWLLAEPLPRVRRVRWLFLRALALVNLMAFGSLATQVHGLLGSHGLLPVGDFLAAIDEVPFRVLPTLAWFMPGDIFLTLACWGGVVLSLLLLVDLAPPLMLALLWMLYCSLVNIGQEFLGYQWDVLLLEVDFLAIWLAPWQLLPRRPDLQVGPPRLAWGMLRLLLVRLMVHSGWVKLASGDPTWRNLTALRYHYWTQPLPTPLAWYANRLPASLGWLLVVLMLIIELGVPWLLFTRWARYAFGPLALLQLLIALTGNYGFFNWLTLTLCLCALDDGSTVACERPPAALVCLTGSAFVLLCTVTTLLPNWHITGSYGLFAVMTTDRLEIELDGSVDGEHWVPYIFRYKPGPLDRPPPVALFQMPRLDWQMWFAALSEPGQLPDLSHNRWFLSLCSRVDDPVVRQLLESGPVHPNYLRARLLRYRFGTRRWWKATPVGDYLSPVRTDSFRQPSAPLH
jgi:hypothetical protein